MPGRGHAAASRFPLPASRRIDASPGLRMNTVLTESRLPLPLLRKGKVREVYEADRDHLLLVASDRVSAFDIVMREAIPRKGAVLTQISAGLAPEEVAAYDAPFPDSRYKAGVRRFPALVPISEDMAGVEVSRAAATWWATQFDGQSFMAIGTKDPVLGEPVMNRMHQLIKGCPEPMRVEAGHFVQEHGEPIARAALQSWGLLP